MAVVFCLILCMNDFLTDFLRRLKSPDRQDGYENSMFTRPLGLLEESFSRPHTQLRHLAQAPQVPGRPLGSSLNFNKINCTWKCTYSALFSVGTVTSKSDHLHHKQNIYMYSMCMLPMAATFLKQPLSCPHGGHFREVHIYSSVQSTCNLIWPIQTWLFQISHYIKLETISLVFYYQSFRIIFHFP